MSRNPQIIAPQIPISGTDGHIGREWWRYLSSVNRIQTLPFQIIGKPPGQQRYSLVMTQPGALMAPSGTAYAYVGTSPAATQVLTLNIFLSGKVTTLGTMTISVLGVVTFPAYGTTLMNSGDTVQLVNQSIQDATFADSCFSFEYRVA